MHADPLLRRVERTAAAACAVMIAIALVLARGRPGPALGVLGGWVLIEVAFRSIASGISGTIEGFVNPSGLGHAARRRRVASAMARIAGRYALLAVLAYVMIARLRLHPVGLMAGASSAVAAAAVEAVRVLVKK